VVNASIHVPIMPKMIWTLLLISAALSSSTPQRQQTRAELWAFTGPWDPRSDTSLRANAARLDVAVTGWIGLDSGTALPIIPSLFPDTMRLSKGTPRRMAIVTSWHGTRFHPGTVRKLASDQARLARAAGTIATHAASMRYAGLVLDLEALDRADLASLLRVVKTMTDSAHARGVSPVIVAIPAADTVAYPARPLVRVADFVMPMLYDQHWSTSGPGPISEPDWVRNTLAMRIAEAGASKVIAALPTYGYRWRNGRTAAEDVTFPEAKRIATQAGVRLTRDARTNTLRAAKPGEWEIWVTDAELLGTLARQARIAGVSRIALWRIGQEDPEIWQALVITRP
jgi:peptidoglycan-N-acetylglucosamine deacetylase